jgi:hypothetical protein
MPSINVNGRYCLFPYVGASASTTFRDSTYVNNICSVSTPNPLGFSLYLPYIPGLTQPNQGLTTLAPGSSYQIISREDRVKWSLTYPGSDVDRLPMATNVKTLIFMIGLDRNSIVVPISSYVLGENSPLSSIGQMRLTNGAYDSINQFNAADVKNGLYFGDTHFRPNSAYRLRNRVPFTFFAPLQSEMGDAYAIGRNIGGEYGMGYRNNNNSFPGDDIYGKWDKIVFSNLISGCTDNNQTVLAPSIAALSSCGASKALFVLGNNVRGQLATNSTQQYYAAWTRVPGQWLDVEMGWYHMLAINSQGHLYACGDNPDGQLGLGSGVLRTNILTLVDNTRTYVELATTNFSSMVRTSNGFLYGCGRNNNGELGIGNRTSKVYTLTQEVLGYTWTSLKAIKGPSLSGPNDEANLFVAITNKKLYGAAGGSSKGYYFGRVTNQPLVPDAFVQEDLNLTDITSVITTNIGSFIQRETQDRYFAAGQNGTGGDGANWLATEGSAASTQINRFTRTVIPSDATTITNHNIGGYNIAYIRNSIVYNKPFPSSYEFFQNAGNYYNLFTGDTTLFALKGIVPTPTPSPTPTRTPTPTPTPTPSTTPITVVPSIATNAIINSNNTSSALGDSLYWYYSSDNFTTFNRTLLASLPGNRSSPLIGIFLDSCFDFQNNDNLVVASLVRNAPGGNYVFLKQTIRNRTTWNVSDTLNDIGTNSIQIAAWNGTDYTQPFFSAGANTNGVIDMFVHRNSNTAVYVFTQIGSTSQTYDTPSRYGVAGAWSFTVNLANNAVTNAVKISNENLAFNQDRKNASDTYVTSSSFNPKTSRLLKKLPDGRIIFKSLYKVGAGNTNYGAVAKIGYYNQATWNGFNDSIAYEIPGTSGGSTDAPNNIAPLFCEFAALGDTYYLAWCTMTNAQANNITTGTVNPGLVLRNIQTGAQVNVDSSLNTVSRQPSTLTTPSKFMHPFDIIAVPSLNQIYVVYTKFTNFVGNYESRNNTFGIFLKRYDRNLNLIDTSTLFTYIPNSAAVSPSLVCPKFSFNVSSAGVLTLILCFAYTQFGAPGNTEFIMTNTPSINNTWSTVLNRTGTTSHNLAYINRSTVCL